MIREVQTPLGGGDTEGGGMTLGEAHEDAHRLWPPLGWWLRMLWRRVVKRQI